MKGKVIFITGANGGIGFAAAEAFAKRGANVVLFSRRKAENEKAQRYLEKQYQIKCLAITGDVTQETDVKTALKQTHDTFGRLDFAFNNAGVEQPAKPLTEQSETDYYRVMDTNVKGVWLAMKHETPYLKKTGGGVIINTASVIGLVGFAQVPLYVASKHAILGLTKSVALEYAKDNIRVNALCPGGVQTDMLDRFTNGQAKNIAKMLSFHPMGRIATAAEIAENVVWLCSEPAGFMTGQPVVLDGGWSAI